MEVHVLELTQLCFFFVVRHFLLLCLVELNHKRHELVSDLFLAVGLHQLIHQIFVNDSLSALFFFHIIQFLLEAFEPVKHQFQRLTDNHALLVDVHKLFFLKRVYLTWTRYRFRPWQNWRFFRGNLLELWRHKLLLQQVLNVWPLCAVPSFRVWLQVFLVEIELLLGRGYWFSSLWLRELSFKFQLRVIKVDLLLGLSL